MSRHASHWIPTISLQIAGLAVNDDLCVAAKCTGARLDKVVTITVTDAKEAETVSDAV